MRQQQQQQQQMEQTKSEKENIGEIIERRNNRGCKSQDFYNWPEEPFEEMDSPLAVQQYIQQLIRRDPSNIDEILRAPEGQDLGAWKIEHLRLFCMQLNRLATKLQECCHPETCNQMTATEQWIFLCAAHKQPNECPAIDYTRHTLDGAASLLNSNKYFPSRVTIKESSVAKLGSVCRRVYRIFSHAYYHHFQVFDEFEKETHLCKRFSKFVTIYELMPKDSLIVPSDGSKPDIDLEKTSNSSPASQTSNTSVVDANTTVASVPQNDNEAVNETKKEPDTKADEAVVASGAGSTKVELTKIKKTAGDETSSNQSKQSTSIPKTTTSPNANTNATTTTTAAWTPSQVSTNTMVKGTSAATNAASKSNSEESPTKNSDSNTIPQQS